MPFLIEKKAFNQLVAGQQDVAFSLTPIVKKNAQEWKEWVLDAEKRKHKPAKETLKVFTSKCWPLPLLENGLSLLDIRTLWQAQLAARAWILENGDYNYNSLLALTTDEVKETLDKMNQEIKTSIPIAYQESIDCFKKCILSCIFGIFKTAQWPSHEPDLDTLQFFMRLASFGGFKNVLMNFFSSPNGVKASVSKGEISFNLKSELDFISDIKKTYLESNKEMSKVILCHGESLRKWIALLAHECTHIYEGSDCLSDHGPWFDATCALIEGRFIMSNPLGILQTFFNSQEKRPAQ